MEVSPNFQLEIQARLKIQGEESHGEGEMYLRGGRIQRGDQGFGQIAMGGWGGVSHHNMQHGGAGNLLVVEE
jgi:hypothetical protein